MFIVHLLQSNMGLWLWLCSHGSAESLVSELMVDQWLGQWCEPVFWGEETDFYYEISDV